MQNECKNMEVDKKIDRIMEERNKMKNDERQKERGTTSQKNTRLIL